MQWVFKVGYKKLVPDLTERLKYWSDCQLVDIRPSGFYPAKSGKYFCIIEDGKDYWKVRGTTDWKSTQKSVYDLKKYLYVADANGRYPWDSGYNENIVPARKRDFFLDYKSLLDSKIINASQFDQIYDKSREGIIVLERDITTLLTHEDAKTRLQSIYSDKTGTIAQNGAGSGTGGAFTIGAAGDYATITLFEADIAAQLTGNLTAEHLDEETAIAAVITFDTDTNTYLLKLTAAPGAEHNGGVYGNGARINYGAEGSLKFDETTDGHLANLEISKLALDISGNYNYGIQLSDCGATGSLIKRMLIAGDGGALNRDGIRVYAAGGTNLTIINNIIYGCQDGIYAQQAGSTLRTIENNTVVKCFSEGMNITNELSSTITIKNNLCQGNLVDYAINNIDFSGANVSEDDTSPDAAYREKDLHTNSIFLDYDNNDYRLNSAGDATNLAIVDDGEDLSGTFTDDIQGQTRSVWYIGASEIVAAGGLSIPVAMHHYKMMRNAA